MKPEFMIQHTIAQTQDLLMREILRILKHLGGHGYRDEIVQELKVSSEVVPEDYIEYVTTSEKTNNSYKPFNFQFNWALKNLIFADFIIKKTDKAWELTEKGRNCDHLTLDIEKEVRALANPIWEDKSKKKQKGQQIEREIEEEAAESDSECSWRKELREKLMKFSPQKFELFARRLVKEMGVDIDERIGVQVSNDGGLDGFGYITSDDFRTARVAIQAKRWEGNVSSPEIDKFRGAMDKYNAEFGIFITTGDYTKSAIEASRSGTRVITLINGEKIADLVAKYQLYVTSVTTYKLGEFYHELR